MPYATAKDGAEIYFKDWGTGPVVTLSHGWPLCSDSWEGQALFLAERGFRVVAHDRRGHGRSTQTWHGNEMDTYADDLAAVVEKLGLTGMSMFGFSTGGGEVARYVGKYGTGKVAKLGLISAVPPLMVKGLTNPDGVDISVFDGLRKGSIEDRSQLYKDLAAGPFFGANRVTAKIKGKVSQGMQDSFWMQGMMAGHKNAYDCIKAFSETDFREDLKKFDKPTLVVHGDDDQVVPFKVGGQASADLLKANGTPVTFNVYEGAPHGLTDTHKEQLCQDMLAFLRG